MIDSCKNFIKKNLYGFKSLFYEMPQNLSISIDDKFDFEISKFLFTKNINDKRIFNKLLKIIKNKDISQKLNFINTSKNYLNEYAQPIKSRGFFLFLPIHFKAICAKFGII